MCVAFHAKGDYVTVCGCKADHHPPCPSRRHMPAYLEVRNYDQPHNFSHRALTMGQPGPCSSPVKPPNILQDNASRSPFCPFSTLPTPYHASSLFPAPPFPLPPVASHTSSSIGKLASIAVFRGVDKGHQMDGFCSLHPSGL